MIAQSDAACFVGIDLHKDTLTACTIAMKDRGVSYRKIACVAREKVRECLAGLPRPSVVAIETVGFYRWLWTEADDLTVLWQHQRQLVKIEQDRSAIDRRIIELMGAEEFRRLRTILESIPGVGLVTAATAIAEIGDSSRFPDGKAIGRHAGLTPTGYASADKNRLGRICKTGSPDLRRTLQQVAAVAIARKILVLMWTLVRKEALYKAREPIAA